MDDITFCLSDCQRKDCFRHPSNIQDRTIPHSYADFKETETCPEFAKDINVPTNDDTISRKSVIDAVHTATYGFICGAEDGDEMTDEDKLVLSINKAVCTAIKALPSAQPEIIRCKDCKDYQMDWATSYPNRHYCATMDSFMPEDGFCSYAERREE